MADATSMNHSISSLNNPKYENTFVCFLGLLFHVVLEQESQDFRSLSDPDCKSTLSDGVLLKLQKKIEGLPFLSIKD